MARPGRGAVAALASLALLALVVPQIGWQSGEEELMSRGSIERELNADAGLNGYWKSLDARAARTAAQVKHLQEVRYQEGEGTAYESQRAKAYFASGGSAAAADAPAPARDGKAHAAPAVLGKGNIVAGGQERAAVAGFFDGLPRTDVAKTGWLAANRRAEDRQAHVREREEMSERTEAAPIDDFWDTQERADRQEGRRHGVRAMSREHDEVLAKNEKEIKDEWHTMTHEVKPASVAEPSVMAMQERKEREMDAERRAMEKEAKEMHAQKRKMDKEMSLAREMQSEAKREAAESAAKLAAAERSKAAAAEVKAKEREEAAAKAKSDAAAAAKAEEEEHASDAARAKEAAAAAQSEANAKADADAARAKEAAAAAQKAEEESEANAKAEAAAKKQAAASAKKARAAHAAHAAAVVASSKQQHGARASSSEKGDAAPLKPVIAEVKPVVKEVEADANNLLSKGEHDATVGAKDAHSLLKNVETGADDLLRDVARSSDEVEEAVTPFLQGAPKGAAAAAASKRGLAGLATKRAAGAATHDTEAASRRKGLASPSAASSSSSSSSSSSVAADAVAHGGDDVAAKTGAASDAAGQQGGLSKVGGTAHAEQKRQRKPVVHHSASWSRAARAKGHIAVEKASRGSMGDGLGGLVSEAFGVEGRAKAGKSKYSKYGYVSRAVGRPSPEVLAAERRVEEREKAEERKEEQEREKRHKDKAMRPISGLREVREAGEGTPEAKEAFDNLMYGKPLARQPKMTAAQLQRIKDDLEHPGDEGYVVGGKHSLFADDDEAPSSGGRIDISSLFGGGGGVGAARGGHGKGLLEGLAQVPSKKGARGADRVTGGEARRGVLNFFDNLAARDKDYDQVWARRDETAPGEYDESKKAREEKADESDKADTERDDGFFDSMAAADKRKEERGRRRAREVDTGAVKQPLVIGSQRLEGAKGGAEKAGEGRREAKEWDEATRAVYTPLGGSHDQGDDAAKHVANQLVNAAKIAAAHDEVGSGRAGSVGEKHSTTLPRRASAGIRARSAAAAAAGAVSGKDAAAKEGQGALGILLDPLGVFGGR